MTEAEARLRIYLTHRKALIDYATPIVGSRASAEDLVQEAYMRFVPQSAQPAVRQPTPYLYRIVRNLALDFVRHLSAEQRRNSAYAEWIDPLPLTASPDVELQHRDELAHVRAALAELPEPKRIAFEMSRFGGLTFLEIARHLNVSQATAHKFTQDALMHVMRCLQRSQG